ncbi:hypothetical protein Lfu02_06110 [Longispora fulva]|uniref:Photosystem II stability/assembly factor-like uncharacterized protein n=1 Tax=Longispora fulva TaxID=619741 RepID=A0A8J7GDA9_9ACTN|nr:hypothetical protein [Longispora fulva]MBG6135521.1 photosystem II stability/assembly factor-like uncharacterized protein [Longispora fulva]GIG56239.1 hypothetical protein Lfu02_06110 [Longispora fulva]
MRKLATGLFTALTATVATLSMTGATATAATTWTINPTCATVNGPGALTYTTDEGATLHATTGTPAPVTYTYGLVALDTANTLLSVQEVLNNTTHVTTRTLYRSTNAGCTWTALTTLPNGYLNKTTAAKGGRAYLWSQGGDGAFYKVSGTTVTSYTDPTVANPPIEGGSGLVGVGTDPNNGLHVYGARKDGQIFESTDGGATWATSGVKIPGGTMPWGVYVYEMAFDKKNPLHAVAGTMSEGVETTFDGGVTWTKVAYDETTHPNSAYGVNAMSVAISPVDSNVVYVQSIDVSQATSDGDEGRQIRRSTDGGLTFDPAIVHHVPGQITLINGTPLYPSASDANVLYFVYGTSYQNYGTDLFRYDSTTASLTKTHNGYHGLNAIAFNPKYPSAMYLGLALEPGGGVS